MANVAVCRLLSMILFLVSFVLFLISFSTNKWFAAELSIYGDISHGLWKFCLQHHCYFMHSYKSYQFFTDSKIQVTCVLACLALGCNVVTLCSYCWWCCRNANYQQTHAFGKPGLLVITFEFIGSILCFAAVGVFGSYYDYYDYYHFRGFSYKLMIVTGVLTFVNSLILAIIAGCCLTSQPPAVVVHPLDQAQTYGYSTGINPSSQLGNTELDFASSQYIPLLPQAGATNESPQSERRQLFGISSNTLAQTPSSNVSEPTVGVTSPNHPCHHSGSQSSPFMYRTLDSVKYFWANLKD